MKTKRTTFEGDNLRVTVARVSDDDGNAPGYDVEVTHRVSSGTQTSIWLDSIDDLVSLTQSLESYLEMHGIRKEYRHE